MSELLTKMATDMEKDGVWDNSASRMSLAEWAADADSSGRYAVIRENVGNWGLSSTVPNFEKFVRHFWSKQYKLGECSEDSVGLVKSAAAGKRMGTKTRYICKADSSGEFYWRVASDVEKDTYQWEPGEDGEIKLGSITQKESYIYDSVAGQWRERTPVEKILGGCIESVANDVSKNTGRFDGEWYKCENRSWEKTTGFVVDTQGWSAGADGDVKKGDSTGTYYVYEASEKSWRVANISEHTLGLNGCTADRNDEMGKSPVDKKYYSCSPDHDWVVMTDRTRYNTVDYDCDVDGKMLPGAVDKKSYFVCDGNAWREATAGEEKAGMACTALREGIFNDDSTYICENKTARVTLVYDFPLDKDWTNPDLTYGTLEDERDGRTYKTIEIDGVTMMAENLNYVEESEYMTGHNWCYKYDPTNCQKGGRFYTWTAAMNIDSKWTKQSVTEGTIKTPHQGICPNGWHIPTQGEWRAVLEFLKVETVQSTGTPLWNQATNATGFSALPVGEFPYGWYDPSTPDSEREFLYVGESTAFWSATESSYDSGETLIIESQGIPPSAEYKHNALSVRCFKD